MFAPQKDEGVDELIRVGDHVCLFCLEASGYLFSEQTNSEENIAYIYNNQDIDSPQSIPNPQVVTLRVCVQNRYKLGKKYRQLEERHVHSPFDEELKAAVEYSRKQAEAEHKDNNAEQKRLYGKPLKYGDIIQLKHIFSSNYIHINPKKTSRKDKSTFLAHLQRHEAKTAQFRILPKYKVSTEGENVYAGDQVIFESVHSPGHFFHASKPFTYYLGHVRCELNLGHSAGEFTLIKRFKTRLPGGEIKGLWGGAVVQLHHKHLEAYLSVKGIFGKPVLEDVHLYVREADLLKPQTLYAPQSCTTYWQLEPAASMLDGEALHWGQQIRVRHLATRLSLMVDSKGDLLLTQDSGDPSTVFRLHPMQRAKSYASSRGRPAAQPAMVGPIQDEQFIRIEHVLTGRWLHGLKEQYERKTSKWEDDILLKVSTTVEMLYPDAFSLHRISQETLDDTNFVMGILPILRSALEEMTSAEDAPVSHSLMRCLTSALEELCHFLREVSVARGHIRRQLMRELQVIDMGISLWQFVSSDRLQLQLRLLSHATYELLTACIQDDLDNCLYMTNYLDFFQAHLSMRLQIGNYMTQLLVELIRDKRQVVDRITQLQIEKCISFVKKFEHHRYLKILSHLCVCDGVAITENQSFIGERLLGDSKGAFLYQFCHKEGRVHIWKKSEEESTSLYHFFKGIGSTFTEDEKLYLEEQLILFKYLCQGRNQHCIDSICSVEGYITWEIAFGVLRETDNPFDIQALFCDLIIALFVDVGENTSLVECYTPTFVYERLNVDTTAEQWLNQQSQFVDNQLDSKMPELRRWLSTFLQEHTVADQVKESKLILACLRLVYFFSEFGYYGISHRMEIFPCIVAILNGTDDLPFEISRTTKKNKGYKYKSTKPSQLELQIKHYRTDARFDKATQNETIVETKYQAMLLVEQTMAMQSQYRQEAFVALFKYVENEEQMLTGKHPLADLIYGTESKASTIMQLFWATPKQELQKTLDNLLQKTSLLDEDSLISILLQKTAEWSNKDIQDVAQYRYDKMTTKALSLVMQHYNNRSQLLSRALKAQLLVEPRGVSMCRSIKTFLSLLRRLTAVKMYDDQVQLASAILDKFQEYCKDERRKEKCSHILYNQGVLPICINILQLEQHGKKGCEETQLEGLLRHTLELMNLMAVNNDIIKQFLFQHLDVLLHLNHCQEQLAKTLIQIFHNNKVLCDRTETHHIKKLMDLIILMREKAPSLLQVLTTLVVLNDGVEINRRNQYMLVKFSMDLYPADPTRVFEMTAGERQDILLGKHGPHLMAYFINLVNVLAVSAKGMSGSIQSFCMNLLSLNEILVIINTREINYNLKRPFVKFLHWVYVAECSSTIHDSNLLHNNAVWDFWRDMLRVVGGCLDYFSHSKLPLVSAVEDTFVPDETTKSHTIRASIVFFVVDAMLPFLSRFAQTYVLDEISFSTECATLRQLIAKCMVLFPAIASSTSNMNFYILLKSSASNIMSYGDYGEQAIRDVMNAIDSGWSSQNIEAKDDRDEDPVAQRESELNRKLHDFVRNCTQLQTCPNRVGAQLGVRELPYATQEYTDKSSAAFLPLSDGFQNHVKAFIDMNFTDIKDRYYTTRILIKQLEITALGLTEDTKSDELTLSCLQILRAHIHNITCLLPEDIVNEKKKKELSITRKIDAVRGLQEFYVINKLVTTIFRLMNRKNVRIFRECISLLETLLYGANADIQNAALDYFKSTREEAFFMFVREIFQQSAVLAKERRYLEHMTRLEKPYETRLEKPHEISLDKPYETRLEKPHKTSQDKPYETNQEKPFPDIPQSKFSNKQKIKQHFVKVKKTNRVGSIVVEDPSEDQDVKQKGDVEVVEQQRSYELQDATVQLILRVMANLCDGQHRGMQNYMREQPDNMKTYNLVATTTQYMSILHTGLHGGTIQLAISVFDTLNELCAGNQENRSVVLDNKLVDYINFILRQEEFPDCAMEEILSLKKIMADLVISLIEESSPAAIGVAKDIAETIDVSAILKTIYDSYRMHQGKWWRFIQQTTNSLLLSNEEKYQLNLLSAQANRVGYKYFIIFARIIDVTNLTKDRLENSSINQHKLEKALMHYKSTVMSIEIIKDGYLQKVYFPVQKGNLIRNEIKEKLKWNIDRSSATNKIRDFMQWSRVIIRDIHYQEKINANPISHFISKQWMLWNYVCIFISLIINVFMLATWKAKLSGADLTDAMATLPPAVHDLWPQISAYPQIRIAVMHDLAIAHNVVSALLIISYFLSEHPRLPRCARLTRWWNVKPMPTIDLIQFDQVHLYLGLVHNLISFFLVVSYFLSNLPAMPTFARLTLWRERRRQKKRRGVNLNLDDETTYLSADTKDTASDSTAKLLSFATFYYLTFLAMSLLGTFTGGYFFAFHLLQIVETNNLLQGVIRAVTQNGKSLLWVAILGLILIYIYALVAFAFLRASFQPVSELYCRSLFECFITILRYGMLGDIDEMLRRHALEESFANFGYLVIFQVTFFILFTTIGLNIIFGIIVDTFSELRDLKWQAEKDMAECCFICGLPSYDFEHHAKGFLHHVKHEHNMWAYIYYFIYLTSTNPTDYTALDYYVAKLREKDKFDFFPMNRSLSLSNTEDDTECSRLDDMATNVRFLVDRHNQQETYKEAKAERRQQDRWRRQQRRTSPSPGVAPLISTAEPHAESDDRIDDDDDL